MLLLLVVMMMMMMIVTSCRITPSLALLSSLDP